MQTPTQSPDAKKEHAGCCKMHGDGEKAAQACEMKKEGAAASCCAPGAACCEDKGSDCCAQHKKGAHAAHERTAASSSGMKHDDAAGCCASCEHCARKKEKTEGAWSTGEGATKVVAANVESGAAKSCCAADAGKSACPCCQHAETAEK
jgi:hypothetical protein